MNNELFLEMLSVSLIATSRYAVQVGDAIVENVIKIKDFVYLISPILLVIMYLRTRKNNKN